ncbi:MAG TPA: PDZ domain-containing protein [Gemmatimonadaceae bacterium]|nr:PDZ domain-containing protein [Gemmatimonadaceae bacterium]
MKSLLIFSALAAASTIAVGAGAAGAQEKTSKPDSTCTKYSDGRIECRVIRRGYIDSAFRRASYRMDSVLANRAALGLEVRTTGSKRDSLGVFVEAVTPKGPAENAGIVEGDRIASINGVDLRTSSTDADDEYASAVGPRRLTREVQKLTPGTRVTLRVNSGGRLRDVQVTTGKASDVMRLSRTSFRFPGGGGMEMFGPDRMMFGPEMRMIGPDMQLMRERMEPLMRDRIEPMLREQLRDLPQRIQLRTMPRIRTMRISPRTYRVDRGAEELRASDPGFVYVNPDPDDIIFDSDDMLDYEELPDFEEFRSPDLYDDMIDIEEELEPLSPDVIRDLAATAIQDARAALKQLSEAGIV